MDANLALAGALVLLLIAVLAVGALHDREHFLSSAPPASTTERYHAAGLRNFAPGAGAGDFMMSLSRAEAVCNAFNDDVRRRDCRKGAIDINRVTSPAPDSLQAPSSACDSLDAITAPLDDTDSNVAVLGRVYKFVKMCLPLTFDTRTGAMVNTEEAALCAVLTRPAFLRCTRSVLYSVEYGGRTAFDYVWPSPTAQLSLTAVGDADIAASAVGKKTLTVLLREQSATAATVTLPTTVYLLDEPERPSASAARQSSGGVRVVTLEGEAETGSRDGAYATASVVGNTQLQVRTSASAPRALTVRVQVGRRTPYERTFEDVLPPTRRARTSATLQYAWTVSNTAVIFMLCLPGTAPKVVFGVVRVVGADALAGVHSLPPRAYGYIANYYRVYKRMQQGVAHRATVALPERFTLRPTSMDPTMCLERRDDGGVAAAACARGNPRQQWSDDGRALRFGGACMQVQRDGTTVSAGTVCEGEAMVRYDQKRRRLVWKDGRFCAGDGKSALRMRDCAANDIATYEAVPFV